MLKITTIKTRNHILATKKYKNHIYSKYFNIAYDKCRFECFNPQEINCKGCILIINTKKNCKTSVKRNLLKRRIKEILKNITYSYSLVIYSKPLAFIADFIDLKKNLEYLINKIQIQNNI